MSQESPNPYAVTTVEIDPDEGSTDAELIRKQHLAHEKSIDSIAGICFIAAAIGGLYCIGMVVVPFLQTGSFSLILPSLIACVLSAIHLWAAIELSFYRPRGRSLGIALSCIWILWPPVGTILSVYFLYLLLRAKSRTIFTAEYHQIRNETPHLRYRTSHTTWGVLLVFLLALLFGGFYFVRNM